MKKSRKSAEHYKWGTDCEGWHLLKSKTLSVIQEHMPPGTKENLHLHTRSQQLFYILSGTATFAIEEHTYILEPGDSLQVPNGKTHCIENAANEALEFLVISEPMAHGDRVEIDVRKAYDTVACDYAAQFLNEFENKHFDRLLLSAFAHERKQEGRIIDLGCGPGQATAYLYSCGIEDIIGVDLSGNMVALAQKYHAHIPFVQNNILALSFDANSFGSAIALYAMIHFDLTALKIAFQQVHRILKPNGHFLCSFHIGQQEQVHLDQFLGHRVDLVGYFYHVDTIIALLGSCGFAVVDVMQRNAYPGIEYHSKRSYLWTRKI